MKQLELYINKEYIGTDLIRIKNNKLQACYRRIKDKKLLVEFEIDYNVKCDLNQNIENLAEHIASLIVELPKEQTLTWKLK